MKNIQTNLIKLPIENIENILYNLNMSVRKIKKSYISCTGYFASYKNKTQIAFESTLERDFYMFLEFQKDVCCYVEQPLRLTYEYADGKQRRYTPDTIVTYTDGIQKLFEVKYANEIENDIELQKKLDILAINIQNEYGMDFEIFTDKCFTRQYIDNLKFIYKFAFIVASETKTKAISQIVNSSNGVTVKQILEHSSDNQQKQLELLPYIWHYIFTNIDTIDLQQKLSMNTILTREN